MKFVKVIKSVFFFYERKPADKKELDEYKVGTKKTSNSAKCDKYISNILALD